MLQSMHRLYGDAMSPQAVLDTSGALPAERVTATFDMCRRNDFGQMSGWVSDLLADGFPVSQIVAQMLDFVVDTTDIESIRKAKIAIALAEADKQLTDGAGDYLQLMNVLATTTRNLVVA